MPVVLISGKDFKFFCRKTRKMEVEVLKRCALIFAVLSLLLLASITPTMAAPSVAIVYSYHTNLGIEAGFDLTDRLTLCLRAGTTIHLDAFSYFDGQLGVRYYFNEGSPLRAFASLYAGAFYRIDSSGLNSPEFAFTAAAGGGLEYTLDDGAFASMSYECNWLRREMVTGYSWFLRVGKRF